MLNKAAGILIFVLGVAAIISAFISGGIKSI